jgi:Ca2+-binding EF-hand superfamily protein
VARFLIIGGAAAMALASAAVAQNQNGPKPMTRADYVRNVDTQFNAADTNHDGSISRAELVAQQQRDLERAKSTVTKDWTSKFNQLDTNHDGKLSLAEFLAGAPGLKAAQTPEQMLSIFDANHDGKISADEFRNVRMGAFNKVDTNHDGIITPQEIQGAAGK